MIKIDVWFIICINQLIPCIADAKFSNHGGRGKGIFGKQTSVKIANAPGYFIGCFDTWLTEEENHEFEIHSTHSVGEGGNGTISCINFCWSIRNGNWTEYEFPEMVESIEVALVRDWYCVCTVRNRRMVGLHDLLKVDPVNCDFNCTYVNECGGTFAYSGFSLVEADPVRYGSEIDVYKSDLRSVDEIQFRLEMRCATCQNPPLNKLCIHEFRSDFAKRSGKSPRTIEIWRKASPSYQYAFQNSPLNCINYCRRYVKNFKKEGSRRRRTEDFAILGYETEYMSWAEDVFPKDYPFCFCFTFGRTALDALYDPVGETVCNTTCKANTDFYCGGRELENEEVYVFRDVIYKVSTNTADDVRGEVKKPPLAQVAGCDWKKCVAYDQYSRLWEAYPGEIAYQTCPNKYPSDGRVTWDCLPDGEFRREGPNYEQCSNKWIPELIEVIPPIALAAYKDFLNFVNVDEELSISEGIEWISELQLKTKMAKIPTNLDSQYYGHEIKAILDILRTVTGNVTSGDTSLRNITILAVQTVDNMLTNLEPWSQLPSENRTSVTTETLKTLEFVLYQLFVKTLDFQNGSNSDYTPFYYGNKDLKSIEVLSGLVTGDDVSFPPSANEAKQSYINVPREMIPLSESLLIYTAMQVNVTYIQDKLPGNINGMRGVNAKSKILNGPLLGFSFYEYVDKLKIMVKVEPGALEDTDDEPAVSLTFQHEIPTSGSRATGIKRKLHHDESVTTVLESATCVFWDERSLSIGGNNITDRCIEKLYGAGTYRQSPYYFVGENSIYRIWSTEGCRLEKTSKVLTACKCNHLTYFSVLMSLHKYEAKDEGLEALTIALSLASTLTLVVSLISFLTEIDPSQKAVVTKHLSVLLLCGNISMLLIVDRNYLHLSETICSVAAILTTYIFTTATMIMGAEGWLAYHSVMQSFTNGKVCMAKVIGLAYAIPVPIIGATAIASYFLGERAFGGIESCWLEGNYIWSFLSPAIIIFGGNFVIIAVVVRAAYKSQKKMALNHLQKSQLKLRLRGMLSLSVILGLGWFLGLLILIPDSAASITMAYVFTTLNASQGILVALFHCFLMKQHRGNLVKKIMPPSALSNLCHWQIPKARLGKLRLRSKRSKPGKQSDEVPETENLAN